MKYKLHILFFLFPTILFGQLLPTRPATALNTVTLYPDSSFFNHSTIVYQEGALFEVLDETYLEHEDASQNQKFKWFYVQATDQKKGWIYGDGLAVLQAIDEIDVALQPYYLKAFDYGGKQSKTTIWIASIEGRDNLYELDHLNPLYKEQYLVFTSPLKKSTHIQLSGQSAAGISELQQLRFTDINEDGIAEVIIVRSSIDKVRIFEERTLEIHAFQAGAIAKVFEERLTLTYLGEPSPALFKMVEIGNKTLRIAYVDYIACKDYSLSLETNEISKTQEQCLEYVTYTHLWSADQQSYQPFYEESRTYLTAVVKDAKGYILRREPSYLGEAVEELSHNTPLTIIKHYEKIIKRSGKKIVIPYFYAKTANGNYGYIHANKIQLQNIEHTDILAEYYQAPPLLRKDWTTEKSFVFLKKDLEQVVTGRE